MKILINLSTMKDGGGQNVALNFLHAIFSQNLHSNQCIFMVARKSEAHSFLLTQKKFLYFVVPKNPCLRILFEIFKGSSILRKYKIEVVYSYFGYACFTKRIPQIIGSADSNLYYPDVEFWRGYQGINRIKRFLVDKYRIFGVKHASAVIFENPELERRGKKLFGLRKTCTIRPSIYVTNEQVDYPLPTQKSMPKNGLFLCGWHLNKNVLQIPDIAAALRELKHPFNFVLTAPKDDSSLHRQFVKKVKEKNVSDMILFPGVARKNQLSSLYSQIDYVFLLSKLESFSNTIIEAWHFGKPLVVSDEPWARAICMNAAEYVNRESPIEIAQVIIGLSQNPERVNALRQQGFNMLKKYPNIVDRIKQELQYVQEVYETL